MQAGNGEGVVRLGILHIAGTALALATEGLGSWHRRSGGKVQPHWFSILQVRPTGSILGWPLQAVLAMTCSRGSRGDALAAHAAGRLLYLWRA